MHFLVTSVPLVLSNLLLNYLNWTRQFEETTFNIHSYFGTVTRTLQKGEALQFRSDHIYIAINSDDLVIAACGSHLVNRLFEPSDVVGYGEYLLQRYKTGKLHDLFQDGTNLFMHDNPSFEDPINLKYVCSCSLIDVRQKQAIVVPDGFGVMPVYFGSSGFDINGKNQNEFTITTDPLMAFLVSQPRGQQLQLASSAAGYYTRISLETNEILETISLFSSDSSPSTENERSRTGKQDRPGYSIHQVLESLKLSVSGSLGLIKASDGDVISLEFDKTDLRSMILLYVLTQLINQTLYRGVKLRIVNSLDRTRVETIPFSTLAVTYPVRAMRMKHFPDLNSKFEANLQ
jgi:hypothetical protein